MTETVVLSKDNGTKAVVAAEIIGKFAVHKDVLAGGTWQDCWKVTHVATGMGAAQCETHEQARAIARALDTLPGNWPERMRGARKQLRELKSQWPPEIQKWVVNLSREWLSGKVA